MGGSDQVEVLVVDDSHDLAELLTYVLEEKGYTVRMALNGAQALEMVAERVPHCVILDVHMPAMNGREFAQALRARYHDDIVLIAVSGHAQTDGEVAFTYGIVDHYFQKPFDFAELDKILPVLR